MTEKVRRKEERAWVSSEAGRVINNENAVYVNRKGTAKKTEADKIGALKNRKQKPSLARNNGLLFSVLLPSRKV